MYALVGPIAATCEVGSQKPESILRGHIFHLLLVARHASPKRKIPIDLTHARLRSASRTSGSGTRRQIRARTRLARGAAWSTAARTALPQCPGAGLLSITRACCKTETETTAINRRVSIFAHLLPECLISLPHVTMIAVCRTCKLLS